MRNKVFVSSHNVFDDAKPKGKSDMSNVYADFLLNKGLYEEIEITQDNIDDLIALTSGSVRVSVFCKECGEMRVFASIPICYYEINEMEIAYNQRLLWEKLSLIQQHGYGRTIAAEDGSSEQVWDWKNWQCEEAARLMVFSFICAMDENHRLDYAVITDDYTMRKIGQYPSVADLSFPELNTYKKIISKQDRSEMGRALGLYASGIGVGSYVYLRRIFERILVTAKENAGEEIDTVAFNKARVDEKITMLKAYLPDMLTSNTVIYGILSKGIHELTEEECREYFPVVKDCIFMILNEWEQLRKKAEREKAINASLSRIAEKIK